MLGNALLWSLFEDHTALVQSGVKKRISTLNEIKGLVPSLFNLPPGCSFAPRCALATERCREAPPPLEEHRPGHYIACWNAS